ncbi:MAG TPA: hypothetical protein VFM70_07900 [Salinimicrobium sp.]|nr:hypothetical protein [Salinimicrobium sp.]
MKYFLSIISITILVGIGTGYYYRNTGDILLGDQIIGVAILATVFIFMPVFLYHRWKGKKLEDYTLTKDNIKKMKDRGLD